VAVVVPTTTTTTRVARKQALEFCSRRRVATILQYCGPRTMGKRSGKLLATTMKFLAWPFGRTSKSLWSRRIERISTLITYLCRTRFLARKKQQKVGRNARTKMNFKLCTSIIYAVYLPASRLGPRSNPGQSHYLVLNDQEKS